VRVVQKTVLFLTIAAGLVASQSCKYLFKSDYATLNPADLSTLAATLPEQQQRLLAQNEPTRKKMVEDMKRAYSLAQAAESEGIDKSAKFTQQMALSTDQLLAVEWGKKNPTENIPKEECDAYYAAHKTDFDNDFKTVNEGRKDPVSDEVKEQQRALWSELKVRAARARKSGLEKDPTVLAQIKFGRANVLANLYARSLEEKFKPTEAERKKYLGEHPEADPEKLKEKAQGLLDRVKKGESFEKIADEANEDGTKGRGGELPWFSKGGQMDPTFESAAFALQKGQMTEQLVKSSFGYHIIRVDDRRMSTPPPATPGLPPPTPAEEVLARHIYVSTQEAESFERKLAEDKIRRALEDASLKYPVGGPADFSVKVAGLDSNRVPGLGGGQSGQMKSMQPGENK
jgi:peptidyl-prolyl cis-trans isomerase C